MNSPFNVISQSLSFKGEISGEELLKNIYFSKICPEGIPYNWTGLYRPNHKICGFRAKKSFIKNLKKNNKYSVNLMIEKQSHPIRVLNFEIKDKSKKTIIINAHNCHKF